jgi:hypothetical protein
VSGAHSNDVGIRDISNSKCTPYICSMMVLGCRGSPEPDLGTSDQCYDSLHSLGTVAASRSMTVVPFSSRTVVYDEVLTPYSMQCNARRLACSIFRKPTNETVSEVGRRGRDGDWPESVGQWMARLDWKKKGETGCSSPRTARAVMTCGLPSQSS